MPTTDAALRPKALSCLREGRVTVLGVKLDGGWRPVGVVARVRSSRGEHRPYRVQYRAGQWTCTCALGERNEPCPHATAVALVTIPEASDGS